MQTALEAAKRALLAEEVPIGAVLVQNGHIVAQSHNMVETKNDPTAHAEIEVIRQRCAELNTPRLPDHDLYVTLEPCAMCAQAISHSRIRRVYFGAYDPKGGGVDHGARVFSHPTCHHVPDVVGGLEEQACADVLKDFFKDKR